MGEDITGDVRTSGAKRNADADLARAMGDELGENTVKTNG